MRADVPGVDGSDEFFFSQVAAEEQLRQEVFHLGYHLHWSYSEIMSLDTVERREILRMLIEAIERQNEAMERAARRGGR